MPDQPAALAAVPRSRYVFFLVIAATGLALDLTTKSWIFGKLWPRGWLDKQWTVRILDGIVELQVNLNEGALFGLGQGWRWFFIPLSGGAVLFILYLLFCGGAARSRWMCVTLAFFTAGILGNLYDRLGLHGLKWPISVNHHAKGDPVYAVRDWILIHYRDWVWPNFNLADSLLVTAVIMFIISSWQAGPKSTDSKPDVKDSET